MKTVGELFQDVATSGFAIGAMFGLDGRDGCLCPDRYNCTVAGQHAIAGDVECETSAEIIANGRRYGAVAVPRIDLRRNGLIGISVDLNDQEAFATLQRLLGVLPSMLVIARRIAEASQPGQRRGRMVSQIVYVFRVDHADRGALKNALLGKGVSTLESGALSTAVLSLPAAGFSGDNRQGWINAGRLIPSLPVPWLAHIAATNDERQAAVLQAEREAIAWSNGTHPDQQMPANSYRLISEKMLANGASVTRFAAGHILSDPHLIAQLREAGADLVPVNDPRTTPIEAPLQPGEVKLLNDFHAQFVNFYFDKKAGFRTSEPLLVSQLIRSGAPLAHYMVSTAAVSAKPLDSGGTKRPKAVAL